MSTTLLLLIIIPARHPNPTAHPSDARSLALSLTHSRYALRLSKLANMQENVGSSVFCMEYCIKLFYYSWSAYKQVARRAFAAAGDTSYPFSVDKALRVFGGLTSFDEVYDEESDTYCIMLRSPDTIVLSFRGTASRKNAMTDIKLMSVKYEPCPTLFGFPVLVRVNMNVGSGKGGGIPVG
jgi:hypothetical protein